MPSGKSDKAYLSRERRWDSLDAYCSTTENHTGMPTRSSLALGFCVTAPSSLAGDAITTRTVSVYCGRRGGLLLTIIIAHLGSVKVRSPQWDIVDPRRRAWLVRREEKVGNVFFDLHFFLGNCVSIPLIWHTKGQGRIEPLSFFLVRVVVQVYNYVCPVLCSRTFFIVVGDDVKKQVQGKRANTKGVIYMRHHVKDLMPLTRKTCCVRTECMNNRRFASSLHALRRDP